MKSSWALFQFSHVKNTVLTSYIANAALKHTCASKVDPYLQQRFLDLTCRGHKTLTFFLLCSELITNRQPDNYIYIYI